MTLSSPTLQSPKWFALADAESCRLLCRRQTPQGTQHVEEFDAIINNLPEQEHLRPMTSGGATHYVEETERRFAAEILGWLRKKAERHEIDHVVIFAPPRMLGVLRMAPLGSLKGHVEELKGDFMRFSAGQLADHSMIRELMTPRPSDVEATKESKASDAPLGAGHDQPDQSDRRCVTA